MEAAHWVSLQTIENKQVYYRYQYVKCHRRWCTKCPHGPYLYKRFYKRVSRKLKRVWAYIGKIGSEKEQYEIQLEIEAEIERERVRATI